MSSWARLALALPLCACHSLKQGTYQFTALAVQSDPCHLAPSDGGLWSAQVVIFGDEVQMTYSPNGLSLPVIGQYSMAQTGDPPGLNPFSGAPDAFLADGTATEGVSAAVGTLDGGLSCGSTDLAMHMDAAVLSDTEFQAEMSMTYGLLGSPPNPSGCPANSCELQAKIDATWVSE